MADGGPLWGNEKNDQFNTFLQRVEKYRDARMAKRAVQILETMRERSVIYLILALTLTLRLTLPLLKHCL